jgi:hypothetical protein
MNIDVALNRIAHQKVSFFFNSFFFKKKIVSDTKIGFPAAAGWLRVKKTHVQEFRWCGLFIQIDESLLCSKRHQFAAFSSRLA